MRRLFCWIIIIAASASFGWSQTPAAPISGQVFNQYGSPVAGAQVYICNASASTGLPCSPVATIYSDFNLTMPTANPTQTDANGNFNVFVGVLSFPNIYVVNEVPQAGTTYTQLFPGPSTGSSMVYPAAGITRSTGSAWDTPATYPNIVALWASGSCVGFLKNDGTCGAGGGSPGTPAYGVQFNHPLGTFAGDALLTWDPDGTGPSATASTLAVGDPNEVTTTGYWNITSNAGGTTTIEGYWNGPNTISIDASNGSITSQKMTVNGFPSEGTSVLFQQTNTASLGPAVQLNNSYLSISSGGADAHAQPGEFINWAGQTTADPTEAWKAVSSWNGSLANAGVLGGQSIMTSALSGGADEAGLSVTTSVQGATVTNHTSTSIFVQDYLPQSSGTIAKKIGIDIGYLNPATDSTALHIADQTTYGGSSAKAIQVDGGTSLFDGFVDASGATQVRLPVRSGMTTLTSGEFGYDTAINRVKLWNAGADTQLAPIANGFVSGDCASLTSSGGAWTVTDPGKPCPTGTEVYLLNQTICALASSTDASCTGTISLGTTLANTSYEAFTQITASTGAFIFMTVTAKSTSSFTYALTCTFNCSSIGTPTADVYVHHN